MVCLISHIMPKIRRRYKLVVGKRHRNRLIRQQICSAHEFERDQESGSSNCVASGRSDWSDHEDCTPEESELEEKWIVRQSNRTTCYWPNGPNTKKNVQCQMAVGPLWEAYPVRVLVEGCETYERARSKCKKAEDTSDLNSGDELGRGCLAQKRKFLDDEEFSTGSGDSEEESGASHFLPPPPRYNPATSGTKGKKNVTAKSSRGSSEHTSAQSSGERCVVDNRKAHQPETSYSSEWRSKVDRKLHQILENQNEILAKLDLIARKENEVMNCENLIFENLPLRAMPKVAEFEEELSNGNTRNQFVNYLKKIGGFSVPDATRRCLKDILTNEVGKKYSLDGLKGNHKLGDTNIYSSITCAVMNKFPAATRKEVDKVARDWLRHCSDRMKSQKDNV